MKVLKIVSKPRPVKRAFARLEPCAGRLASTVLRGLGASNGPWLPDQPTFATLRLLRGVAQATVYVSDGSTRDPRRA